MSTSFIKGNRTRYGNLLQVEMDKGKALLEEESEQYGSKVFSKNLNNCIRRLTDFISQLEETDERLSIAVEGQDGAQEAEQLIKEDWSYIAALTDCRDELVDLQNSLQDQKSPAENLSSITVTEDRFNEMIQMTTQMQQVLIGQQQQQSNMEQSIDRQTSMGNSVRIPKLEISSFYSNKLKWTEFRDSFEASVDKNITLSDIEN